MIGVNEILGQMSTWDLSFGINGKEHVTRRPCVGELEVLRTVKVVPDAKELEFVASLFVSPKPDIAALGAEEFQFLVGTYAAYFAEHAKKNSPNVTAQVKRAISTFTSSSR